MNKFFFILLFTVAATQAQNANIGADEMVKINRAEASEAQPNHDIDKSFDSTAFSVTQAIIPPVFTDETCSELRTGVNRKTIKAIENDFYKQLALSLFNNSYEKKYRVWEIKPANGYYCKPVSVQKGDTIIVFSGKTDDGNMFLRVVYYNTDDEYTHLLHEGINIIIAEATGLLCVMYLNDKLDAKPVKIHFATGKIDKKWYKELKRRERTASATNEIEKINWSQMLTPEQMKKDIDYFFKTVSKVHVNMYAFVSKEEITKIREQLYRDCSKPLMVADFNRRIRKLNNLFDGHTQIDFNSDCKQTFNKYDGFFPLPVKFAGGKIYLLDEEEKSSKHIISFNGTKAEDIYNRMINPNELKDHYELYIPANFSFLLFADTDIRSPYEIVLEEVGGKETIILQGVPLENVKRIPNVYENQLKLGFRMYPEQSIAIIDYNSCGFGRDSESQLNHWFDTRFKQISDKNIKNLFIDISRNGGGSTRNNNALFKQIRLDNPLELKYKLQTGRLPNAIYIRFGRVWSSKITQRTPPNPNGFAGNIYLIQGLGTYSAAVDVSEWFNALPGAKLIGDQTGGVTDVYIEGHFFSMPNAQIPFVCSYKHFQSLPVSHKNKGVQPDYNVELDYSKPYYELNDLLGFMSQIDPNFEYQPYVAPVGTKVAVKSATANCFQPRRNIDRALDGDYGTLYHSPWDGKTEFPVILTFNFEGVSQIDFFRYYPVRSGLPNGLVGKMEIWASTQSDPVLKKIELHDFFYTSAPDYCQFSEPVKNPLTIKLCVLSSTSWHGMSQVSIAEIEFYKNE